MADTSLKARGYRAVPRQGMRKWSVIHDVDGQTVVVAEFHSYSAAMVECTRLNAQGTVDDHAQNVVSSDAPVVVESKLKVLA